MSYAIVHMVGGSLVWNVALPGACMRRLHVTDVSSGPVLGGELQVTNSPDWSLTQAGGLTALGSRPGGCKVIEPSPLMWYALPLTILNMGARVGCGSGVVSLNIVTIRNVIY